MEQNALGPFSKNVFKGSVLVTTLMEHYPRSFRERSVATRFAQKLISLGHIRSTDIQGNSKNIVFDDSTHLYQWCDQGLLEDARKLARNNMTKCNITEKKLSELVDTELDNEVASLTRSLEKPNLNSHISDEYPSPNGKVDDNAIQEISYDQIVWSKDRDPNQTDNKAADLGSVDLRRIHKENEKLRSSVTESLKRSSLSVLADQDDCYSDNEKQLLEDMKRMQQEHENVVTSYESRINELMEKMSELKNIAELLDKSSSTQQTENSDNQIRPEKTAATTNAELLPTNETILEPGIMESTPKTAPPPPVPPPPAPTHLIAKPNKPPIQPRKQMRTLFWSRILLKKENEQKNTLWHELKEPEINTDEFESFFSTKAISDANKQSISLAESMTKRKSWCKSEGAKILNEKRSRVVSIRMKSMHCDIKDIENAIYNLDFTKCSIESLKGLNEIRATPDEIKDIKNYIDSNKAQPLDEAEKFLFEISKFTHFAERLDCIVFKEKFVEIMFTIDQQTDLIIEACSLLKNSENLRYLLEIVLVCGNYMNGGTARGQADGFNLDILNKIKDVKGVQNSMNLLNYTVRMYITKYESEDAGKNGTQFKLPDPAILRQAGYVSFSNIDKEITRMKSQLLLHRKLAGAVVRECEENRKQPFQNKMTEFLMTADDRLVEIQSKINDGHNKFQEIIDYLALDITKTSTEGFFSTWAVFLEDCRRFWRAEQRRIARDNFERVDNRRKAKKSAVRPASVDRLRSEDTSERKRRPSLKQRFSQIKNENETKSVPSKDFQPVRSETPLSVRSVDSILDQTVEPNSRNADSDFNQERNDKSSSENDSNNFSRQDNMIPRKRVVTARPVPIKEPMPVLRRRVDRIEAKSINGIESKMAEESQNRNTFASMTAEKQVGSYNGVQSEKNESKSWMKNHEMISSENLNNSDSQYRRSTDNLTVNDLDLDSTSQGTQTVTARRASVQPPPKRSSAAQTERRRTISGTHRSLKQLALNTEKSAFKPVAQRSNTEPQSNQTTSTEPPPPPPSLPLHLLDTIDQSKTGSSESLDQLVGQTGSKPRDRTPLTPNSKTASSNIENYINLTLRRKESLAKTRAAFENVIAKKPEIRSQNNNAANERQNVSKQAAIFDKRGEDRPPPLPPRAAFSEKLQQFVALKSKYQVSRNQRRASDLGSTQSLPGAVRRVSENGTGNLYSDSETTKNNTEPDRQIQRKTAVHKPPALELHKPQIRTQKYEENTRGNNIVRKLSAKLVRSPVLTTANPSSSELDTSLDSSRSSKSSPNPSSAILSDSQQQQQDATTVFRSSASLSMRNSAAKGDLVECDAGRERSATPQQNDYQNTIRRVSMQHSTMFHNVLPNTPTDKV
ncbi:uncharacterized protein LOC141902259 [Tubulanus polymorphus]|uniref:uncharacterized protein LOC141902259 n=1 Tax=Tubulanus polymorphus TaxID=672921 RepID=UPI003DA3E66C